MQIIRIDPTAPQKLTMVCRSGSVDANMALVTSSVLRVKKPDGATATWATTISGQSPAELTLSHVFTEGDVDVLGNWRIYPVHTSPSGTSRGDVQQFMVVDEFELT